MAPIAGCRTPSVASKGLLVLKDHPEDDAKDVLVWKWLKGAATSFDDLGDPVTTDGYAFCVYDATRVISRATLPAGGTCGTRLKPCWSARIGKHYQYKDPERAGDGVQSLFLKAGSDAKASIVLQAKGNALDMPALGVLASPLTAQLLGGPGVCWEAVYRAPFAIDTAKQLKAKSE
jgi:hypothetical protein